MWYTGESALFPFQYVKKEKIIENKIIIKKFIFNFFYKKKKINKNNPTIEINNFVFSNGKKKFRNKLINNIKNTKYKVYVIDFKSFLIVKKKLK